MFLIFKYPVVSLAYIIMLQMLPAKVHL